jgi:8-oxo-dGTP pyrophosphatase MutT (NUDIX family)
MTALEGVIENPKRPLPWQWIGDCQPRQVVMAIAVFQKRALLLANPVNAPDHHTWIPVQGGCEEGESIFAAGRREVREEVPSLKRPDNRAAFRVAWENGVYLGSAHNPHARSRRPSHIHCVAYPALFPGLQVNPQAARDATWVWNPETLLAYLDTTKQQNPIKAAIILAATSRLLELGLLT